MNLTGEYTIAAPRQQVWDMITDPAILRDSIPGCISLEGSIEDGFAAKVRVAIGPVKATFDGVVKLSVLEAPGFCTIGGQGQGGLAGFAKGEADVTLAETDGITTLRYEARAVVGGKIAQLGGRLIEATARKLSGEFFSAFAAQVAASTAPADAGKVG
jgi:carbon monoxide dehydrogenase subunit G